MSNSASLHPCEVEERFQCQLNHRPYKSLPNGILWCTAEKTIFFFLLFLQNPFVVRTFMKIKCNSLDPKACLYDYTHWNRLDGWLVAVPPALHSKFAWNIDYSDCVWLEQLMQQPHWFELWNWDTGRLNHKVRWTRIAGIEDKFYRISKTFCKEQVTASTVFRLRNAARRFLVLSQD